MKCVACGVLGLVASTLAWSEIGLADFALERFARGLNKPLKYIALPDDRTAWVVEQPGSIVRLVDDVRADELAGDLTDRVYSRRSECGLLGIALHPEFPERNEVYVNYTALESGQIVSRISRFMVEDGSIDADSEAIILSYDQPYANHNGGDVVFGPDGYLYIGVGDGGLAGDPLGSGQDLSSLLGKVLRIDIDVDSGYRIPDDNPFVEVEEARDEVYAYGLRNPWGISFDPMTGEMWLADVGQDREEEINTIVAGGNYGWNVVEATQCFPAGSRCDIDDYLAPVHSYTHRLGESVTGGAVYYGSAIDSLYGQYVFADFESGLVWSLEQDDDDVSVTELVATARNFAAITTDHDGELVLVDHGGRLYRIVDES